MEDEIEESTSIWSKKQDELTVGESMKIGLGVTVIATVAPLIFIMAAGGAVHIWEKFKNRKKNKLELVDNEEN